MPVFWNKRLNISGAWLAHLGQHVALDLGVMSSNHTLGVEIT